MREEDIPTVQDLDDIKVKIKEKVNSKGEPETELAGWPEIYPGEFTTTRNVWYRLTRWMIGAPRRARKKVKGYGWMLLVGIGIFIAVMSGALYSAFGTYMFLDYFGWVIAAAIVWYFIVRMNHYFGAYRRLEKGERYPIAYEKDETGKIRFLWETAKETVVDIFKIPYEALDFIFTYGVIEERATNGTISWNIKGFFHNLVWGPLLYADLDTTQFSVLHEQVAVYPENMQRALDKLAKYGKKNDIAPNDLAYLETKTKEMYAIAEMLQEDEKEILDLYGRRLVKVKLKKTTYAFFKAWQPLMQEMEATKLNWMKTNKAKKTELISEINSARGASIEYRMLESIRKEAWEAGRKYGATETEKTYAVALGSPSDFMQAEKAPIAHDANQYVDETIDKKWKEKISKEALEIGNETDDQA